MEISKGSSVVMLKSFDKLKWNGMEGQSEIPGAIVVEIFTEEMFLKVLTRNPKETTGDTIKIAGFAREIWKETLKNLVK